MKTQLIFDQLAEKEKIPFILVFNSYRQDNGFTRQFILLEAFELWRIYDYWLILREV